MKRVMILLALMLVVLPTLVNATTVEEHIAILNEEMGIVQNDVAWIKAGLTELKREIAQLKILTVGGILVPILLVLIKPVKLRLQNNKKYK